MKNDEILTELINVLELIPDDLPIIEIINDDTELTNKSLERLTSLRALIYRLTNKIYNDILKFSSLSISDNSLIETYTTEREISVFPLLFRDELEKIFSMDTIRLINMNCIKFSNNCIIDDYFWNRIKFSFHSKNKIYTIKLPIENNDCLTNDEMKKHRLNVICKKLIEDNLENLVVLTDILSLRTEFFNYLSINTHKKLH